MRQPTEDAGVCMSKRRRVTLNNVNHYIESQNGDEQDKNTSSRSVFRIRKSDRQQLMSFCKKDVKNRNTKCLKQLLNSSLVNLTELDPKGRLLMSAVQNDYLDIIEVLLEYGTPIECDAQWDGLSPLHYAVKYSYMDAIHLFIDHNINLNIKTMYEQSTALHMATKLHKLDVVMLLLQNNADPDVQDSYGCTALHLAASYGFDDIAQALLNFNANVNSMDFITWTPLHHAVISDHANVTKVLLQNKANISAQTKYGKTALHIACDKGYLSSVEVLLSKEAVVDIIDIYGRTPVDYAENELIISLVTNADKTSDIYLASVQNINMRLKSKSLIDFLDKDFMKEDFYPMSLKKAQRIQSVPTLNKKTSSKSSIFNSSLFKPFKGRKTRKIASVGSSLDTSEEANSSDNSSDCSNFFLYSSNSVNNSTVSGEADRNASVSSDDSVNAEIPRIHFKLCNNKLNVYEPDNRLGTPLSMCYPNIVTNPPSSTPKLSKEQYFRNFSDESENTLEIPDLSFLQEDMPYRKNLYHMDHFSSINTSIETIELSTCQYTANSDKLSC